MICRPHVKSDKAHGFAVKSKLDTERPSILYKTAHPFGLRLISPASSFAQKTGQLMRVHLPPNRTTPHRASMLPRWLLIVPRLSLSRRANSRGVIKSSAAGVLRASRTPWRRAWSEVRVILFKLIDMLIVPFDYRRPAINKARLKFGTFDSPVAADPCAIALRL